MSNYWNNIDECLSKLVNDGYCYLPSIKNILDLENISISIDKDISENIYSENIPSHLSFCNEFGITNILGQKLFEIAKDLFNYKGLISNQYHIARKVSPGLKAEAYRGHFDSHLFTLVMPIQIPKKISDDSVGDLIFVPNARSMPNHEIINFFQKIYFKKYASKKGFDKLKENKEVLTEAEKNGFCFGNNSVSPQKHNTMVIDNKKTQSVNDKGGTTYNGSLGSYQVSEENSEDYRQKM